MGVVGHPFCPLPNEGEQLNIESPSKVCPGYDIFRLSQFHPKDSPTPVSSSKWGKQGGIITNFPPLWPFLTNLIVFGGIY